MKKLSMFGENLDYYNNLKRKIVSFTTSRLAPFLGFTLIIISISRFNYPELGNFSYLTSLYSLPVVLLSMPLAMIGNIVVSQNKENNSGEGIFVSGIFLCLALSIIGFIASLILHHVFIKKTDTNIMTASEIYIFCVPLLIINTYLFYFIESFISNKVMARIKLYTTILCAAGTLFVSLTVPVLLTWHVFTIFLVFECLVFLCYSYVVYFHFKQRDLGEFTLNPVTASVKIMKLGLPVALGLAGQKLVYFLLTLRLLEVNKEYISQLSVFMSVLGFLALPVGAFTQLHSLYISSMQKDKSFILFWKGVISLVIIYAGVITIMYPLLPYIINIFGTTASNDLSHSGLYLSLLSYFFATSLMLLCMSHLRALNDTFYPQCTANIVLLILFIPFIWMKSFNNSELSFFLNVQSVFLLIISFILIFRIKGKGFISGSEKVISG